MTSFLRLLGTTILASGAIHSQAAFAASEPANKATTAIETTGTGDQATSGTGTQAPTASQSAISTQDIIVTAQKRSQSILQVPLTVNALSGSELVEKGISSVQDLARVVPGLSFVESGRSTPVFSLRGVGFFDLSIGARPTVSIYNDEAPVPFSIEARGSAFDLERVEVLKGPQGTLFGQNATGGAINYIAAKPTDTLHAGGTIEYSRFNTVDAQAYLSGPLTSNLSARIALRSVRSDDWQYSYTRHDGLGKQRFLQGRILTSWKPSTALTIGLNVNGYYDGSDTQAAQLRAVVPQSVAVIGNFPLLTNYPLPPKNDRAADWDVGQDFRARNWFVQTNLRADYTVSTALVLTSLTSYSHQHVNQLIDADGTNLQNFYSPDTGYINSISEELRASGALGRLHYIIGANYAHDHTQETPTTLFAYSTTTYSVSRPPAPQIDGTSSPSEQRFDTKAVFANVDFDIFKTFTLHGGLRYTEADLDWAACTTLPDQASATAFSGLVNALRGRAGLAPIATLTPGACASLNAQLTPSLASGKLNQNNVAWRAGIDWKPFQRGLVYFNVSRGYKAGSLQNGGATLGSQFIPASQESVLAYELGAKTELFNRMVQLTGAAFYYDYSDKQVLGRGPFPPFGTLPILVNIPKSRVQGVEGEVVVRPAQGLRASLSGTYLDSKVLGSFLNYDLIGSPADFGGDPFPYTPKYQLNGDADYRFAISDKLRATIGGSVTYRSSTVAGFGNSPLLNIPAYTLIDLRAGIGPSDERWELQIFGRNITNEYYLTNVARNSDVVRAYTGQPARYGIRFTYKY